MQRNNYTMIRCISALVAAILLGWCVPSLGKEAISRVIHSLTINSCLSGICSNVDAIAL
ncbi:MAG TPA: hypothetical protein VIQ04_04350 [Nitrososphaeraceae archaeon]